MPVDNPLLRQAATIIVAASDSLHPERADLICDGVADNVEIQAALDALPATGGRVILLDGTFNTIANITVPATSTLEGQGFNTIVIPAGAAITNGIILNGNDIRLENFKIDLAAGCGTGGARPNVVYAINRNHLLIENMYIIGDTSVADDGSDLRQIGILFDNVDNSKIRNVWSEDNDRHGIHLYNGSDFNEVIGCTCNGNTQHGILLYSSSNNNTVTGNTCNGNTRSGILLYSSSNNTVTGNTCQGNTEHGISLSISSSNNTVTGNTCNGNTRYGIYLYDASNNNTVTGNTCNGNTWSGILLYSSSNNNTVTGNTCVDNDSGDTNTYDGIHVDSDSDYNLIEANKCYVTTPGAKQRYGIRINSADCNGNFVIDNDLLQGGRTGNFSDAGTGTIYFSPEQNIAMDLLAEDTNHVVVAEPLNVATPIPCTIAAQIAKPRNITITITDGDVSISAFQIDVVGINTKGEAATEQFLFAGGLVQVGNVAWAHITSITVTSITGAGAGDVLDVGIGSKLGITGSLYIGADVYHVVKNTLDWPAANYTVDLTYDTVDISTGGAINAGDDCTIFFKASRNRIK